MEAYVKYENQNGIAVVEFYHPQSNSLPGAILRKLAETITEVSDMVDVNVIVLRSGGERAFCAGASFDELIAIQNETDGKTFFSGFAQVINACRKSSKLIIGRVQGKAVGGGVGVASACDYVYATTFASVKLSELAIGIGPFVVGPAVQRKLGTSAFSMLATNATQWQSAIWAKEHGLYHEVYESTEEMDEALMQLAQTLNKSNPQAMTLLKKIYWEGTENWDQLLDERAAMSGKLVLSDFTRDAIQKFKTK